MSGQQDVGFASAMFSVGAPSYEDCVRHDGDESVDVSAQIAEIESDKCKGAIITAEQKCQELVES